MAALILLSSCLVTLCEEGSCSKDSPECGDEERSLMVESENKVEDLEEDEGIVNENDKTMEYEEIEEVDGLFEPCTKSEKGGQLYKMMILNAGYKLSE